jgi:exodeoxyribonuclease III
MNKGFSEFFDYIHADAMCLQETKLQPGQLELELPGYYQYWNSADKKGYSGTALFTNQKPLTVSYGMAFDKHDHEGRIIVCEYDSFQLINVYTPNSQRDLPRLPYRMEWEDDFRDWVVELDRKKPVVICGDLNVAHREIDLKNSGPNRGSAGFTDEERDKLSKLLEAGFVDSFRHLNGDIPGCYTWWSYMFHARENNAGWRIDYFLVSERIKDRIVAATILPEVQGSDHCPVLLELDI